MDNNNNNNENKDEIIPSCPVDFSASEVRWIRSLNAQEADKNSAERERIIMDYQCGICYGLVEVHEMPCGQNICLGCLFTVFKKDVVDRLDGDDMKEPPSYICPFCRQPTDLDQPLCSFRSRKYNPIIGNMHELLEITCIINKQLTSRMLNSLTMLDLLMAYMCIAEKHLFGILRVEHNIHKLISLFISLSLYLNFLFTNYLKIQHSDLRYLTIIEFIQCQELKVVCDNSFLQIQFNQKILIKWFMLLRSYLCRFLITFYSDYKCDVLCYRLCRLLPPLEVITDMDDYINALDDNLV